MTTEELLWDVKFEQNIDVLDYPNTDMELELARLENMTEEEAMLEYNCDSKAEQKQAIIDYYA